MHSEKNRKISMVCPTLTLAYIKSLVDKCFNNDFHWKTHLMIRRQLYSFFTSSKWINKKVDFPYLDTSKACDSDFVVQIRLIFVFNPLCFSLLIWENGDGAKRKVNVNVLVLDGVVFHFEMLDRIRCTLKWDSECMCRTDVLSHCQCGIRVFG